VSVQRGSGGGGGDRSALVMKSVVLF
jgi:hypothetical protein